jgi:hypothetical protein
MIGLNIKDGIAAAGSGVHLLQCFALLHRVQHDVWQTIGLAMSWMCVCSDTSCNEQAHRSVNACLLLCKENKKTDSCDPIAGMTIDACDHQQLSHA